MRVLRKVPAKLLERLCDRLRTKDPKLLCEQGSGRELSDEELVGLDKVVDDASVDP
jgi:hypothetical protein